MAASYYEILGVASTASPEEVRRAYRQRARALHPDRHVESANPTDAGSASSLRAMQVLNEAWRVLGDQERRSVYDRLLAGGRTEPAEHGQPGGAHPRGPGERPFPRVDPSPASLGASLARGLPWVMVLAVLGAIFVFTAFAGGSDGGPDVRSASDLVGTCVQLERGGVVNQVSCDGPSDGRVDLVAVRASLCPDEADVVRLANQESWLCLRDPRLGG